MIRLKMRVLQKSKIKKKNTDALNCLKTKEKKSKKRKIKDADLQIDKAVKKKRRLKR